VRRLTGDELLLPVPVTEFAGFFGNCSLWGASVPADELVVSEVDALVPAFVLTREASASPLMQHVLAAVNALECMARLREHMTIGHISSEVNVTADLPSRGRISELVSIAEHAGANLIVEPHPGALDVLLSELVQLELDRRPATALGSHNICMDGRPLAHVERVPACADVTISLSAPAGPQRNVASADRPSPYARPRVERHVPVAAVAALGHQHAVVAVDLPERSVTTTRLEAGMLQLILRRLIGKVNASKYSWHSARIYLACSLLAAGASHAQIQALCRWQTEDSLRVYARLNPGDYAAWISKAFARRAESTTTRNLPTIVADPFVAQLQADIQLLEARAGAPDADDE
jgi:hypothetical protein